MTTTTSRFGRRAAAVCFAAIMAFGGFFLVGRTTADSGSSASVPASSRQAHKSPALPAPGALALGTPIPKLISIAPKPRVPSSATPPPPTPPSAPVEPETVPASTTTAVPAPVPPPSPPAPSPSPPQPSPPSSSPPSVSFDDSG
jgi:hypothetical protein